MGLNIYRPGSRGLNIDRPRSRGLNWQVLSPHRSTVWVKVSEDRKVHVRGSMGLNIYRPGSRGMKTEVGSHRSGSVSEDRQVYVGGQWV